MEWIKFEDKLPENEKAILITNGEIVTVATFDAKAYSYPERMAFFDGHGFSGYEWDWLFDENSITHWMPLPEAPKD